MSETGNKTPALSERVRSLRLQETPEPRASVWSWLPWVLCALLLLVSGALAMEALSPIDDDLLRKLAEERNLAIADGGSGKLAAPVSAGGRAGKGDRPGIEGVRRPL